MAVQINWNICDNADVCGGIDVCPTGALFWDETTKKIGIDNDLCISCRLCAGEDGCPIGAIIITDSEEEYIKARDLIDNDTRTKEQLFVDRYGAMPVDDGICISPDQIKQKTKGGLIFVERFVNDIRVHCLLHSIKVDDIRIRLELPSLIYYKCELVGDDQNTCYPCLDVYKDGQLLGTVKGYYEDSKIDDFINEIEILLG